MGISIYQVEFRGVTGPIQFKEGRRMNFKLDLLKLKQHSVVKVRCKKMQKIQK